MGLDAFLIFLSMLPIAAIASKRIAGLDATSHHQEPVLKSLTGTFFFGGLAFVAALLIGLGLADDSVRCPWRGCTLGITQAETPGLFWVIVAFFYVAGSFSLSMAVAWVRILVTRLRA